MYEAVFIMAILASHNYFYYHHDNKVGKLVMQPTKNCKVFGSDHAIRSVDVCGMLIV